MTVRQETKATTAFRRGGGERRTRPSRTEHSPTGPSDGPPLLSELVSRRLQWYELLPCDVPWDGTMLPLHDVSEYHASACGCDQCQLRLTGQFFFADYYCRSELEPDVVASWIKACLSAHLAAVEPQEPAVTSTSAPVTPGNAPLGGVRLFGRVDSSVECAGARIWLCRFLVALPVTVSWDRLWEKILCNPQTGAMLPLGRSGAARDRLVAYPWRGETWRELNAFYKRCKQAIVLGSDGQSALDGCFGDEYGVNAWRAAVEERIGGFSRGGRRRR